VALVQVVFDLREIFLRVKLEERRMTSKQGFCIKTSHMQSLKRIVEVYALWYFIVYINTPSTCWAQIVKPGRTPATRAALFQNFSIARTKYQAADPADRNYPFALVFRSRIMNPYPIPGSTFSSFCARARNTDPFSREVIIFPVENCGAEDYESMRLWRTYMDSGGGRHWEMRRDGDVPNMDFYHRTSSGAWVSREMWDPWNLRQVNSPVIGGIAWAITTCIPGITGSCPQSAYSSLGIDVLACSEGYDIGKNGDCQNINECGEIHECPANSDCVDTTGDYRCVCKTGRLDSFVF
jgi:hypothetical protein